MPETTATKPHDAAQQHPATIVGSTFMRQYYHFLAKEPASLHRFYKDESVWCHGVGSHMQDPISGQQAINDEILSRGYAGARVDLDIGSIDCQASLNGGVFVLVTGVMTLASSPLPKPFVQTFFLAVQPKGYFVLNDCLRFLELPGASSAAPSAADVAVAPKDVKKQPTQAAIGTPVTAASPAPKSKPATPVAAAKKDKTPASPVTKPVETPVSPVKVKSPVKVASPKAAPAAPASPVKKAAPVEAKTTQKPSETKPATPASPAAAKPAAAAAKPAATPASPAAPAKPTPATPVKPAEPVAPAAPPAPKTWAALFSAAPAAAAPAAPATAPKAAPVAAAKPAPASPAPAAAAKPADAAAATAAAPQEKEKKRYSSLYIRDIPAQTKDSDLRELFKPYGAIANVTVPAGRGFAFVDYFEPESMRAALADTKEFKVYDKVIIVEERSERKDKDRSGFRTDTRGGRGGRGAPKSGRTGERKEREDGKERRAEAPNGKAPASSSAPRSNANGERRDKGGRRSGKEGGRAE